MPARSSHGALAAALALAALAALAAGCSGSGNQTDDPAVWADRVCTALVPLVQASDSKPAVNATDFAATKQAMSLSLATAADAVPKVLSGLDAAGQSPIAGGDAVVAKLRELTTAIKGAMLDVKIKVDAANPADPGTFIGVLADALGARATLATKVEEARQDVKANPDVKAAALKGASCPQVGLGSDATAPPSSGAPSSGAPSSASSTPAASPPPSR